MGELASLDRTTILHRTGRCRATEYWGVLSPFLYPAFSSSYQKYFSIRRSASSMLVVEHLETLDLYSLRTSACRCSICRM